MTEAIEIAATSRRNSALDDVCAESFVVVIADVDVTTNASDEAKRADDTRNIKDDDFMMGW